MTVTLQRPEQKSTTWQRMRLLSLAHAVDDLYQGLVPASVPYFVLERHYGYVAASGVTLAATLGSSLPQPFFGVVVDRLRAGWMAGAGVGLAGLGLSLAGMFPAYAATWCMILLSGLGVAMFHPAAGKGARQDAGDSAGAMSLFAAGGSVGFFLAPALATPALIAMGAKATVLFLPPAVLMSFVLLRKHRREASKTAATQREGRDQWRPFAALTCIEVLRSAAFFGLNTFLELYWIRHLNASRGLAGVALTCFLAGGVAGTLLGGCIADRIGTVRTIQLGTAVTLPTLGGLLLAPGSIAPLPFALATGISLNIPFAVLVKLGQDYLPTRPGTAAGVTLGLGVSIGGLFSPLLGLVADAHGPHGVLVVLLAVPPATVLTSLMLREPAHGSANPRRCSANPRPTRASAPPYLPGQHGSDVPTRLMTLIDLPFTSEIPGIHVPWICAATGRAPSGHADSPHPILPLRVWLELALGGVMAGSCWVVPAGSWTPQRAGRAAVPGSPPVCRRGGAAGPVRLPLRWPPRLRRRPGRVSSTSASA